MERQESMIERRLRQNVATVEQQAARISELEAQLAEAVIANKLNIAATYAERNVTSIAEGMIGELKARIAELEMHLAAAAETIAQHARADAAAWGASFEQQNEHAANATAQIRALLNGGMPVRDDTRRRDSRIAELEDLNDAYARQISEQAAHSPKAMQERIAELEESLANAEVRMDAMEADLAQARLLLVAIDENLDMDVNPLTYTTRRIVELLRDPARNPWAALMRAGKEAPKCATCNGEGAIVAKCWPREYVTREMAMDAGDLSLEGSLYSDEEYEYAPCPDCAGKEGGE